MNNDKIDFQNEDEFDNMFHRNTDEDDYEDNGYIPED